MRLLLLEFIPGRATYFVCVCVRERERESESVRLNVWVLVLIRGQYCRVKSGINGLVFF